MRSKKALIDTVSSILYEIVFAICGMILPRLILEAFGSSYNGITSSITQFLSYMSLLVSGIGAVSRAALYKPLADKDTVAISAVFNATDRFMKRSAMIFLASLFVMAILYPALVSYEFDWMFSFTLVLILGASTVVQYFFGSTAMMILQADQKMYIVASIRIITTILNTLLAFVFIKLGCGIHLVKLGSAVAFSLNPIIANIYVRKKYKIDKKVPPNIEKIKQRWDAFWQEVAHFIHNNAPVMVLTIFADIKDVSVYTVYNYVVANIRHVLVSFVSSFGAAFGNMLARNEYELAKKNLRSFEIIIFNLVSVIYTTMGIMILPFVSIYTSGITDVEYLRPIFALVATVAGAVSCFRIPYHCVVEAAGHFKQTRNGAFIEAILNVIISVILVLKIGLVGVAVGTLVATIFRSIQYSTHVSKHIIKRSNKVFWGHIVITAIIAVVTTIISNAFFTFATLNYLYWAVKSVLVVLTSGALTIVTDFLFFKNDTLYMLEKVKTLLFKKKEVAK